MISFEDLTIRKVARKLTKSVYTICKGITDRGFTNQIQRASVSIMNNIAEGYDKESNKEKYKYFGIAKGSCAEVRSMIYLAKDLGYVSDEEYTKFLQTCYSLSKMIYTFMKKL